MNNLMPVRIGDVKQITPIIREFTFESLNQALLPFSSGSHIVVNMPLKDRTIRNAYSLMSDPLESHQYQIAVRLQENSRGGSRYLHEQAKVGDILQVSPPLNLFSLHSRAKHHIFIAGGIGITPFISHIKYLLHIGGSFELHFACRDQLSNAYEQLLTSLFQDQIHIYSERTRQRLNLKQLFSRQPLNSHVYVCGPDRLIEGVQQSATALGWCQSRIHWEAFTSPAPGIAFDVNLLKSQKKIHVASEFSLLEALENHGIDVPNLCRGGVCGQCAVKYHHGEVDHQDHFLSEQEKQHLLMPCVSRTKHGCSIDIDL
ncbi:oxidoreductase [Acinetobacter qingfengensis]|uniref:Ferredoxin n=1 Tax=Acinetobacter qingfengensis TaxID=1262585 RepID=A0A1E7REM0_9GAMM|nr:PDR/VanB family oxidoreductase [Acinetobacter qingfengensis]KAA8735021.1 oxidoreductase [Acinetobacter qingfengensis]OEY97743.1 ferredoxin [Acinetobacter qingfengensis]